MNINDYCNLGQFEQALLTELAKIRRAIEALKED